jgi:hypothetical protein
MENKIILLLMLLLFLGVLPNATKAQSTQPRSIPAYTLADVEMGVYSWITPDVDATITAANALSIMGFRGVASEVDGLFRLASGNRTFEMDSRDGSMRYADYSKLWNVSLGIEIPTPSACVGIAEDFLSDNGLLPVGASLLSVGSSNISAFNPETLESLALIIAGERWNCTTLFRLSVMNQYSRCME